MIFVSNKFSISFNDISAFLLFVFVTTTPNTCFPISLHNFIVFNASVTAGISGFVTIITSSTALIADCGSFPNPAAPSTNTISAVPSNPYIAFASFVVSTFFASFNDILASTAFSPDLCENTASLISCFPLNTSCNVIGAIGFPKYIPTFGVVRFASSIVTFFPKYVNAAAKFIVVVVFPTPPFADMHPMYLVVMFMFTIVI